MSRKKRHIKPLIYLASPYTASNPFTRWRRRVQIGKIAAKLVGQGHIVYAPIAQNEVLCDYNPALRMRHNFWMQYDINIVKRCDEIWVAMMDGWRESAGVREEIRFGLKKKMKVKLLDPETFELFDYKDRTKVLRGNKNVRSVKILEASS